MLFYANVSSQVLLFFAYDFNIGWLLGWKFWVMQLIFCGSKWFFLQIFCVWYFVNPLCVACRFRRILVDFWLRCLQGWRENLRLGKVVILLIACGNSSSRLCCLTSNGLFIYLFVFFMYASMYGQNYCV